MKILKIILFLLLSTQIVPLMSEEPSTSTELNGKDVFSKLTSVINKSFECSVYEGKDALDSITEDGKLVAKKKTKVNELAFQLKSGKKFHVELKETDVAGSENLKIRTYRDLPEYTIVSKGKDGSATAFILSPDNKQTRILKIAGKFEGTHYELQCDPK